MGLKERITEDMKQAMRARDAARLSAIRLLLAAIKQREVDGRKSLDDAEVVAVIDKMIKQRRDAQAQYQKAGRDDLARAEGFEIEVLSAYLPAAASEAEIAQAIDAALRETGAGSLADLGRVMSLLKPRLAGRADLARVSAMVKARLSG